MLMAMAALAPAAEAGVPLPRSAEGGENAASGTCLEDTESSARSAQENQAITEDREIVDESAQCSAGRVCILGVGHCDWELPRHTGTTVGVKYGTQDKINNDHDIPDWLIGRAVYWGHPTDSFFPGARRDAFRFTAWEWECDSTCVRNPAKKVNLDFVINRYDGKSRHGLLVTMFCRGYSGACPSWIANGKPYYGPIGPQDS